MATIDTRTGSATGPPLNEAVKKILDFAVTPQSAGELVQLINVPKGATVKELSIDTITPEGGTLTLDVGDASAADGYLAAFNGNTAGLTASSIGSAATYEKGVHYAAAGVIGATPGHDADVGKYLITARMSYAKMI
jgi:hypothetical protein